MGGEYKNTKEGHQKFSVICPLSQENTSTSLLTVSFTEDPTLRRKDLKLKFHGQSKASVSVT